MTRLRVLGGGPRLEAMTIESMTQEPVTTYRIDGRFVSQQEYELAWNEMLKRAVPADQLETCPQCHGDGVVERKSLGS